MAGFASKTVKDTYNDLLQIDNVNAGIDTTTRPLKDGAGNSSALGISDDIVRVKPVTDDGTAFDVQNKAGTSLFSVDSSGETITAVNNYINTHEAWFNWSKANEADAFTADDTHALGHFGLMANDVATNPFYVAIGTGTDPDTSLSLSSSSLPQLMAYWILPYNITLDLIKIYSANANSSGTTSVIHLVEYDIDTSNSSTSGDLSNGVVIADHTATIQSDRSAVDFHNLTIQQANVNSGKCVVASMAVADQTLANSIKMQILYHLR